MKPSDERKLFLLSSLSQFNDRPDMDVLNQVLIKGAEQGFDKGLLLQEVENMDSKHEQLLGIQCLITIGGFVNLSIQRDHWLTSSGEDYLYDLQHPEEGSTLQMSTFNIQNMNNNGQTAFGDGSSFTDDHSVNDNHSQTINIDESIHQLLSVENQLPDNSDKEQLRDLAAELESALKSSETPKPKFLSRFKNFIGKTWEITGPVITPLLVELGKQTFF